MGFMQPHIEHADYYEVSANHGETWIVPADVVGTPSGISDFADYVEGRIDIDPDLSDAEQIPERKSGWLARLSAPGYMDRTDWSAHATEQEARDYLSEMYGDDE